MLKRGKSASHMPKHRSRGSAGFDCKKIFAKFALLLTNIKRSPGMEFKRMSFFLYIYIFFTFSARFDNSEVIPIQWKGSPSNRAEF